ncbi:DUF4876 domain-containing protein [Prevotella amnii]|uniref:DUF4876 domain-containing protein n=1 Tax=Prevotella amnii TaxID=419005 RepID=UPI000467F2E3|nr:DUF4876 domain-containing protein [Prevotella amnii]
MKKINCMLALACMSLSTLFVGCQRNGDMPNKTDANSKVNHLIFKEVFYTGYLTWKDLSMYKMDSQYARYTDANYLVIANPTDKPISLANMAIAVHAADPSMQYSLQAEGNGTFVNRYYGISGMSYFPNDPVTKKPHIIQPGDSVIIVKYACDHKKKFFEENEIETGSEYASKSSDYMGWEALPDYSKLPKDKTFELCNQREPNPDDKYDNKDIPNMKDLVLWDDLPFSGVDQSMRIALVKLPDGDATKPHVKDAEGFFPDESPRSRNNWYALYEHYATERDAINDESDPAKKKALEDKSKYPTAYYQEIYVKGGTSLPATIELDYNWVVDFLTICPSSNKKFDLLTAPSEVTMYDAKGRPIMENGNEKKEKVWWYDAGTASVCKRIYGSADFANTSFNPLDMQGALIRRTDGKGFVAQMNSSLNFAKGIPSLCKRDEKGKPTFNAEAYWKVNSIQARTKKK